MRLLPGSHSAAPTSPGSGVLTTAMGGSTVGVHAPSGSHSGPSIVANGNASVRFTFTHPPPNVRPMSDPRRHQTTDDAERPSDHGLMTAPPGTTVGCAHVFRRT